mgnify:CR=1 FL=1
MHTIAFVGPSGTGKSHRAIMVSKKYNVDAIIDDGLLIAENKVLAGVSAKREPTRLASVRRALFVDKEHARQVRNSIRQHRIERIMILGTSDGMVQRIAAMLELPEIEEYIRIEDISTPEEMEMARNMRQNEGQHVIPVPSFEIKKDFSGYFLHPLRLFQKSLDSGKPEQESDKTIVRPTFSYLGDYMICDNVIADITIHETKKNKSVFKVNGVNIRKSTHGAHIDVILTLYYGCDILETARNIQKAVVDGVERYSAVNARRVHILVKNLKV